MGMGTGGGLRDVAVGLLGDNMRTAPAAGLQTGRPLHTAAGRWCSGWRRGGAGGPGRRGAPTFRFCVGSPPAFIMSVLHVLLSLRRVGSERSGRVDGGGDGEGAERPRGNLFG